MNKEHIFHKYVIFTRKILASRAFYGSVEI